MKQIAAFDVLRFEDVRIVV